MKTNVAVKPPMPLTHEGAQAARINGEQQLRRLALASMLWEDQFYIDGRSHADILAEAVGKVDSMVAARIAIEAREEQKLRHLPLFIVRELARRGDNAPGLVRKTLTRIVQRPDEIGEFLSLYWRDNPDQPLSNQVKKGVAAAFRKFDAYQLAKWNKSDAKVRLRDAMFLSHPKPKDGSQQEILKALAEDKLATPDTWEVALSAGGKKTDEEKREQWVRLLTERKLGALALLRNLRNMQQCGVPDVLIAGGLDAMKVERVLPFRFVAAARHAPTLEPSIEQAMFRMLAGVERLPGHTVLVIDNSVSMADKISAKSDLTRADAACAVAVLLREICESVTVVGFGSVAQLMPARRGFALRDAIRNGPSGGTNTDDALNLAQDRKHDRIIVITDEQSHQTVRDPLVTQAYFINVASYENGIGYGKWHHIDGWSEAVVDYIIAFEKAGQAVQQ